MKDDIRGYVEGELLGGTGGVVADDTPLLTSGLLDSMAVMRLVRYVEERMGRDVPPEDLTLENFETVAALAAYLDGRAG